MIMSLYIKGVSIMSVDELQQDGDTFSCEIPACEFNCLYDNVE